MMTRRTLLGTGAAVAAAASVVARSAQAETPASPSSPTTAPPTAHKGRVITPNGVSLPYVKKGNVKVFHLVAEPVEHEFMPGLQATCWGYNGRTCGPTIEAVQGDRVRIYVTNKLPEGTSVHWHGVLLENGQDGVAGLTQKIIAPGETYRYEFTLKHAGTFMYHPHADEMTQMALGMMGMLIVHPAYEMQPVQHDFAMMLSTWRIPPGHRRPDPMAMTEFNVLTFNSKAYPGTAPLVVKRGDRVRLRFGNLSAMDHHSIHLHGHAFRMTATDGGFVPASAQHPETTVLVPVGTTRVVEFIADNPGDWPMHCHMTHHAMNQMGHGTPNLVGVDIAAADKAMREQVPGSMLMGARGMGEMADMRMPVPTNTMPMRGGKGPFGTIDMGGMFTILKVRDVIDADSAAGWYQAPPSTLARAATAAELADDGIDVGAAAAATPHDHQH